MFGQLIRFVVLLLIVLAAVVVYCALRRTPQDRGPYPAANNLTGQRNPLRRVLTYLTGRQQAPDYVSVMAAAVRDTCISSGNQWIYLPTKLLLSVQSEQHHRGLQSHLPAITAQVAAEVRKFVTDSNTRGMAPIRIDTTMFHIDTLVHPRGLVRCVAVDGPDHESDLAWRALRDECANDQWSDETMDVASIVAGPDANAQGTVSAPGRVIPPTDDAFSAGAGDVGRLAPTEPVVLVCEVTHDEQQIGLVHLMTGAVISFGRDPASSVVVDPAETSVSGSHLRLECSENGTVWATDLSSVGTILTYPSGVEKLLARDQETVVEAGEVLRLGRAGRVVVKLRA